ncbi:MAG: spondin domain-containing protein [Candidatus Eisenbacteria bacterium]
MFSRFRTIFFFLVALLLTPLVGCGDDDDNDPMGPGGTAKTFTVTIANVSEAFDFLGSGAFDTPAGGSSAAPIGPGEAYEFRIAAAPGGRLSFATMFVQSNDLFYAPDGDGIALFDGGGAPLSGDVTSQVFLWDGGTEMNEEPGIGANQAPRQGGGDTGPVDMNGAVRLVGDGYAYPAVSDVIEVTVTHEGGNEFTVRIANVSTVGTLMTSDLQSLAVPLAPGVWVVHSEADPLFTAGSADGGDGLEALAEDGNPAGLAAALAARSGVTTPLAPGVFAVHTADGVLFTNGQANGGYGLEGLAEDASPGGLAAYVAGLAGVSASGTFTVPDGGSGAGPIFPGGSFSFTFTAVGGDRLSFATMFGQSNDLFYAFDDGGIALFDGNGDARTGDVTASVDLWDAGTEMNQYPGAGPDQAPRQSAANTGAADSNGTVRRVADGYEYPADNEVIRITISATD